MIPTDYRAGHPRARLLDAGLADRYVAHTMVGDPEADALMAALAGHAAPRQQGWIAAGIDGGAAAIPDAPEVVRDFFQAQLAQPDWFDPQSTWAGCRAFQANSRIMLAAFVGAVLVQGFATGIARSFAITGRITDQGVRRLQQNNRHLLEIFLPGGLEVGGDGRRLSIRIRLVHARIRRMLNASVEWDTASWGVPLSAAHIAYANAAFSGLLLARAERLGVRVSQAERESFMLVWRYTGQLMGVPNALLCETQTEALAVQRIGALCEPPPDMEAIMLANSLINSAPLVAGIEDPQARRALVKRIYAVSRQLIGHELADALRFPRLPGAAALAVIRLQTRGERWLARLLPGAGKRRQAAQFQQMMDLSFHDAQPISYRTPDSLHAERDRPL